METTKKLAGKVALITGGTSGIGLATAQRFVAEGAFVFITGRRQAELDAAVQQLGNSAVGVRSDVSNLADLDQLFTIIKAQKGHLDVVFANAGIAEFLPLETVTEDHYARQFDINVKGTVFTVQKALPLLPDGAAIIVMASIVGSKGLDNSSIYSATKAAIRSLARTWTTDLKARRIRVNAISPGPIETPGFNSLAGSAEEAEQMKAHMASGVPLGRVGDADEIAKAVVFLASDDSSFVTGAELFVDGGMAQV
jgi:NAD(P)-dependent dehydrogenase (short-subunit alcohol dehydrogenase family)